MTRNEWNTIKVLISMEFDKLIKFHGLNEKTINDIYFELAQKIERHCWITETKEPSDAESEIIKGFAEAHDIPPLTSNEIEILTRMFRSLRTQV
jgi:hypothetical protein